MGTFWQDMKYGIRMLTKNPGFAMIAIFTLALGIGANTAIFSVVNSVLLAPLPYKNDERLVVMQYKQSVPDLTDIEAQNETFEAFGGVTVMALDYTGEGEPLQVQSALITSGVIRALGIQPLLGRLFTPQEDRFGGEHTVVLTYGFWQRKFGGNPEVIGKSIPLSGQLYTIIGVLPKDTELPLEEVDLWSLVRVVLADGADDRGVHIQRTYCLLKPGLSLNQAQAQMKVLDSRLEKIDPIENKNRKTELIPLQERIVGKARPALLILFGAVCFVLLISCANFANLLLARTASRQQEILVRTALGAGRFRLFRQMMTESILLSIVSGALGFLFASWGIDLLRTLQPENLPRLNQIQMDSTILFFTLGLSLLTGIIFGLAPAWSYLRTSISEGLKETGRVTEGKAQQRLRKVLVAGELVLAIVLLIGAGLLMKTFFQLRSVSPGFRTDRILTMNIQLPEVRYETPAEQARFRDSLLESLNDQPGIQAAMISELPLTDDYLDHNFIIEGRPPLVRGTEPSIFARSIVGDYFRIMQIPLVKGRYFSREDAIDSPLVGIVNQAMVKKYFQNEDPIGARLIFTGQENSPAVTIVGVVGDVRHFGLDRTEEPAIYSPYSQANDWKRWSNLVIASDSDPAQLAAIVKNAVWKLDKQLPLTKIQSMPEILADSTQKEEFNMLMLGIFSAVALTLAGIGIYGVISYSVTQRTHEIGVRMALGADKHRVVGMILRDGFLLTAIALVIGIGSALALTRLMSSLLFGVSPTDPFIYAVVGVTLSAVALLACYLPARRASKVDPIIALRYE